MKLLVTEKQLLNIIEKDDEIDEQTSSSTSSSSATSSAGTSVKDAATGNGAEDFPVYPEVGHWESGVARGPANQVDSKTKWSDTVGSKLTRGKANPLK